MKSPIPENAYLLSEPLDVFMLWHYKVTFFTAGNFCREGRKPCPCDICNFRL